MASETMPMRLVIMQPYFAPALGYFDLLNLCDRWVVFDTAQYRRHSWMNRNRVLHPVEGWQYLTARVQKASQQTAIRDIRLDPGSDWRGSLLRQLGHYAGQAPGYERTVALLREVLDAEPTSLARLNVALLERVCALLGLSARAEWFSQMDLDLGPIAGPGDWALRICEALGATSYVNPPRGEAIFDPAAFSAAGIGLHIRQFPDMTYPTGACGFVPTLSIVDVLMWNEVPAVRAWLDAQKEAFLAAADAG